LYTHYTASVFCTAPTKGIAKQRKRNKKINGHGSGRKSVMPRCCISYHHTMPRLSLKFSPTRSSTSSRGQLYKCDLNARERMTYRRQAAVRVSVDVVCHRRERRSCRRSVAEITRQLTSQRTKLMERSINQSIKIYFPSNRNITVYTVYASAQKAAREAYAH